MAISFIPRTNRYAGVNLGRGTKVSAVIYASEIGFGMRAAFVKTHLSKQSHSKDRSPSRVERKQSPFFHVAFKVSRRTRATGTLVFAHLINL